MNNMKHYPISVAGETAAACVETGWEWATISIKFSHRKGQSVRIGHSESNLVSNVWIDEYPTYTAIRFNTKQQYWNSPVYAIQYCADMITNVSRSINFETDEALVTKELLIILG